MTYRDDHEAALARAAALEAELERVQADDDQREQKVAALERDLKTARAQLDRVAAELDDVKKAEPPPREPAPREPDPSSARSSLQPPEMPEAATPAPVTEPTPWTYFAPFALFGGIATLVLLIWLVAHNRDGSDPGHPQRAPDVAHPDEVAGLIAEARRRIETRLPGARVIQIELDGVDAFGRLGGTLHMDFQGPPGQCADITRDASGWRENDLHGICASGDLYDNISSRDPRCTTRAIWKRAIADGATATAKAKLRFDRRWSFDIEGPGPQFSRGYDDDCVAP